MNKEQYWSPKRESPVLSGHARKRCQQRGIPEDVVQLIVKYGVKHRSGDGYSYTATPKTLTRARKEIGAQQYATISSKLSRCYVVVTADGSVVKTVAWHERHWFRS